MVIQSPPTPKITVVHVSISTRFMVWYCNYLVCNNLRPPSVSAIPIDYQDFLEPADIVTAAASPEAASPLLVLLSQH